MRNRLAIKKGQSERGNRFLLDTPILLYLIEKYLPVDALPEGESSVSFAAERVIRLCPSMTRWKNSCSSGFCPISLL